MCSATAAQTGLFKKITTNNSWLASVMCLATNNTKQTQIYREGGDIQKDEQLYRYAQFDGDIRIQKDTPSFGMVREFIV